MNKHKLLISFEHTPAVMERAHREFNVTQVGQVEKIIEVATTIKPDALLVAHGQKFSSIEMNQLPDSVKVIATSSVGFDHLDLSSAKKRNIILTNTPDVLSDCTADLALLLLLNASRRGREYLEIMKNGWGVKYGQSEMLGTSLRGKTLGILGMGSIGRAVAQRARAFGMKIAYCNRNPLPKELEQEATYFKNFKDMLPVIDVLSLHAPATAQTHQIMNDETFSLMKTGAIFVNVARGSLVNEEALMRALDQKKVFAAGLDVFESEPHFNQSLLKYPQVFLTPHMGSATIETRNAMGFLALDNIEAVLNGRAPLTPV